MSEGPHQPPPATVDSAAKVPSRHRRAVLLAIAGVVVISAFLVGRWLIYARPIGAGPAGPTVLASAFEEPWTQRRVVLLGLGDSITQGLGASAGKSYFQRLVTNPPDEFDEVRKVNLMRVLPNLEAVNLSVSGMTSIECVDYQLPRLTTWPDDVFGVVAITIGGNDVIHNYGRTPPREGAMYGATPAEIEEWKAPFAQRLETIVGKVRESFPGGCHVFIGDIYDPTDGDSDTIFAGLPAWPDGSAVLNEWNVVLREFADRHDDVTLVEIRSAFLGHGIHCVQFWHHAYQANDPHYWYWDNLEDPNDRGYDAIRRLYLNAMADVLPGRLEESNAANSKD